LHLIYVLQNLAAPKFGLLGPHKIWGMSP